MKVRKSRKRKTGNALSAKRHDSFLRPKEGNESSFLQPQARMMARNNSLPEAVQSKMEHGLGEDFSSVNIHKESTEAQQLGAMAFTNGEDVHFAPGQFQPQTTAGQELIGHELAHVKQQRQGRVSPGIQAKGGMLNSDRSLEAEADQFGKKVVLTDHSTSLSGNGPKSSRKAKAGTVQMKPFTDYGEFKTTTYKDVSNYGVDIELEFHPNAKVDATKIGLIQKVNSQLDGNKLVISPTRKNREIADGTRIDQLDSFRNPLYATGSTGAKSTLASTPTNASWGQHATKQKSGVWNPAILKDTPTMANSGNSSHQKFETAALALSGIQKDMYYGSVKWGWEKDGKGTFKRLPVTLASKGDMPTTSFLSSAKKWNVTTAKGTIKTSGDPTKVYDAAYKLTTKDIKKNTIVQIGKVYIHSSDTYTEVNDTKGVYIGLVKTRELVDIGNGSKTIDLPIPWKGTINTTYLATLRQGQSKDSATLADLPNGTKLTVINDQSGWYKVHLDPTQKGLVINTLGKKAIDAANLLRGYVSKELIKR